MWWRTSMQGMLIAQPWPCYGTSMVVAARCKYKTLFSQCDLQSLGQCQRHTGVATATISEDGIERVAARTPTTRDEFASLSVCLFDVKLAMLRAWAKRGHQVLVATSCTMAEDEATSLPAHLANGVDWRLTSGSHWWRRIGALGAREKEEPKRREETRKKKNK